MEKVCENCKYWVASDSTVNWGICAKTNKPKQIKDKAVSGVLRRCDENCWDFKPANAAKGQRR